MQNLSGEALRKRATPMSGGCESFQSKVDLGASAGPVSNMVAQVPCIGLHIDLLPIHQVTGPGCDTTLGFSRLVALSRLLAVA